LLLAGLAVLALLFVWWQRTKTFKSPFNTFWDQVEAAKTNPSGTSREFIVSSSNRL